MPVKEFSISAKADVGVEHPAVEAVFAVADRVLAVVGVVVTIGSVGILDGMTPSTAAAEDAAENAARDREGGRETLGCNCYATLLH